MWSGGLVTEKARNIVLTGFMGTGKTTVGQLVADFLGWSFVDADDEIIERTGLTIPQIFERDGEIGFRRIESIVCQSLAARSQTVIATGGGMLVNEANRELMIASGLVVCLVTDVEVLAKRLRHDRNRPLAQGDWRALMERRKAAYNSIPHQVDTTQKSPPQVAREIVTLWQTQYM